MLIFDDTVPVLVFGYASAIYASLIFVTDFIMQQGDVQKHMQHSEWTNSASCIVFVSVGGFH